MNWNLTPISQDANQQHEREAERPVKDQVFARTSASRSEARAGKAVEYTVRAEYNGQSVDTRGLLREVEERPMDAAEREQVAGILRAEASLASSLVCDAWILNRVEQRYSRGEALFTNLRIPNPVPATIPELGGGRRPERVNLTTASREQLARLSWLSPGDIDAIVRARRAPLTRYEQIRDAGADPEAVQDLSDSRWVTLR